LTSFVRRRFGSLVGCFCRLFVGSYIFFAFVLHDLQMHNKILLWLTDFRAVTDTGIPYRPFSLDFLLLLRCSPSSARCLLRLLFLEPFPDRLVTARVADDPIRKCG